jgi:hypothetical protein
VSNSKPNNSVGPQRGSTSKLPLSSCQLNVLARKSGFLVRKARKLTPGVLIKALVATVSSGGRTLRELALEVGLQRGETLSRRGLWKRLGEGAATFVEAVAGKTLAQAAGLIESLKLAAMPQVKRVLVGDSSTWNLHARLREHYPGGGNQHSEGGAQCRFQLTFDLLGGTWLHARIDPYRRNDRKAAMDIVGSILRKGDLLIRDLGYAVTEVFEAIDQLGAFFLSRLNTTAAVLEGPKRPLNLLELARKKAPQPGDFFSMSVRLTHKLALPCRLIIVNEGEEAGNTRRRRLKAEAKRQGFNHTKEYRKLQNWTLLVTNLPAESAGEKQLRELYWVRWRIENIFKVAKSHTALKKIAAHNTNVNHLRVLLWGWILLMVLLSMKNLFAMVLFVPQIGPPGHPPGPDPFLPIEQSIFTAMDKMLRWVALSIELDAAGSIDALMRRLQIQSQYHHRYVKQHNRITLPDRLANLLNSLHSPSLS